MIMPVNAYRTHSLSHLDPCFWSVADLQRAFRSKTLSPAHAVQACAQQIERWDTELAAFIATDLDSARQAAHSLEKSEMVGVGLAGVPYSLKDNIDVLGWATTCHSAPRRTLYPAADSEVALSLRQSQALLVGKNSLHELATGGPSLDLPWPPARNPWNPALHPGGSSSGSGVAVATGMAYFSLGTDTGGSVRHPASVCGVYGFKPTFERISKTGVVPLSGSCDHVGVLCRSAHDLPAILGVIAARHTDRQAYQLLSMADAGLSLQGLRVGVIDSFSWGLDAHPEFTAALERMIEDLQQLGAEIRTIQTEPLSHFLACSKTVVYTEAYAYHGAHMDAEPHLFGQRTRDRIGQGRHLSVADYVHARDEQRRLTHVLNEAMSCVDVCLSLSSLVPPSPIDDVQRLRETYDKQARVPFSLTGLPAVSVPAGMTSSGLPIGLQFSTTLGRDVQLVAFVQALEDVGLLGFKPPVSRSCT